MVDDGEDWRGYYAEAKMHVRRAGDRDAGHCPDRLQFSGARRLATPPKHPWSNRWSRGNLPGTENTNCDLNTSPQARILKHAGLTVMFNNALIMDFDSTPLCVLFNLCHLVSTAFHAFCWHKVSNKVELDFKR